jgi:hypothetical protein
MRKTLAILFALFAVPAAWAGDYFTVGGMWAYGSNVSSGVDVQKQDLEVWEGFAAITLEEETFLALRGGSISPRETTDTDLDLDFLAMTVSYLFPNPLGSSGFYAGPAYYSGDIVHFDPELPADTQHWTEEVEKLGATFGVEALFPLSQSLHIYAQLSGHYIPADEEQVTMQLGLGVAARF